MWPLMANRLFPCQERRKTKRDCRRERETVLFDGEPGRRKVNRKRHLFSLTLTLRTGIVFGGVHYEDLAEQS